MPRRRKFESLNLAFSTIAKEYKLFVDVSQHTSAEKHYNFAWTQREEAQSEAHQRDHKKEGINENVEILENNTARRKALKFKPKR